MPNKLTNGAVLRLARIAGTKRLSKESYNTIRNLYGQTFKRVLKDVLKITFHSKRTTVSGDDVKYALKSMGSGIHAHTLKIIDPKQKKAMPIPLAVFKRQLKVISPSGQNGVKFGKGDKLFIPRYSNGAVLLLRQFMVDQIVRYIRSATGLAATGGKVTLGKRPIQNVHTVCSGTNWNVFRDPPKGVKKIMAYGPQPKKKKKNKSKKKKKGTGFFSGTEIMSE